MQPDDLPRPPGVLALFRVYCGIQLALSLVDLLSGVGLLMFRQNLTDLAARASPPLDQALSLLLAFGPALAVVVIGVGALMTTLFGLTFFLPRNPWAWILDLALIGLGLTDCVFFLPCLFLMIFWLKPDNRTYFGCDRWMS